MESGRRRGGRGAEDLAAEDLASAPLLTLDLEAFDLVPQCAVLGLVGRPYLLLRRVAEFVDFGFHDGHAERLQLRFGLRELVDRLGYLTDLLLPDTRETHDPLLVPCR